MDKSVDSFDVGDRVYNPTLGWGLVIRNIDRPNIYLVRVQFYKDIRAAHTFTKDGRITVTGPVVLFKTKVCNKIEHRIECHYCGYPGSEALYPDKNVALPCDSTDEVLQRHISQLGETNRFFKHSIAV